MTGAGAVRFCLLLTLLVHGTAVARQVLVRNYANPSLEVGQGYLTHYDGICYLLTPTHVLAESGSPAALLREGTELALGETGAERDLGDDVSIARVSGALTGDCGYGALSISRAVDRAIRDNGIATVRSVNGDGSIAQIAVSLFDDDGVAFLRLQPTHTDNQLRKGLSGALLVVGDMPVAMLLLVDARFGVGKAIRMDAMLGKFDGFVRGGADLPGNDARSTAPPLMDTQRVEPLPMMSSGPTGLPLTLVAWSTLPVDAAHRPTNLVSVDVNTPGWRARVEHWPVTLEFGLGDDRVAIREIRLEAGAEAPALLPGRIEIFATSTAGQDRWRSVANGLSDFADGVAVFSFAPTWARKIRLVVEEHGDPAAIALHRIRVMAAE